MTALYPSMDRAFDAMKQYAIGNEAPLYKLAGSDAEAAAFIQGLHPEYPVDWVRDPWPGEVVDPIALLPDHKVYCCCTVGEIQAFIRAVIARDAARAAAVEAMEGKEELNRPIF